MKCNGSSCGGENEEEKLQRIKSSLDLFVLLHQGKRKMNYILRFLLKTIVMSLKILRLFRHSFALALNQYIIIKIYSVSPL